MNEKHFKILKFLSEQSYPIKEDDFPEKIKRDFIRYSISNGSLHHELEIVLKINKRWINSQNRNYTISDNGKLELQGAELEDKSQKFISEQQFNKLNLEVINLENKIDNFKVDNRRANWAIIIAIIAAALPIVLKYCTPK